MAMADDVVPNSLATPTKRGELGTYSGQLRSRQRQSTVCKQLDDEDLLLLLI